MRHITDEGIELIKRFEGFSSSIYICPAGYPTIGYGHVVRDDEKQRFAEDIDKDEGENLLRRDVRWAEGGVLRLIDIPLTDGQFDALVSFTFNLGTGALQRSTLRRKVNREEHDKVLTGVHAVGVGGWKAFEGVGKTEESGSRGISIRQ